MPAPASEPAPGPGPAALIDGFMPRWDARERHRITVRAPVERVYAAVREADLARSPAVRALLALRALPGVLAGALAGVGRDRAAGRPRTPLTLSVVTARGFHVLAERPPHELLIGVQGRFWKLRGGLCAGTRDALDRPIPPGAARAAWDFRVTARPDGRCELSTETRVACADAAARRRFRAYWLVVRPGSGIVRRLLLTAIRDAAERGR